MIEFEIPGRVVPAVRMTQRSRWSPRARHYLAYRALVGWRAQPFFSQPFACPVSVSIHIFIYRSRADLDNELKAILDGLNGIAWHDDRQVQEAYVRRLPCPRGEDRVVVRVVEIEEARSNGSNA